ncbi:hypothetical protein B0H34DRAFT_747736 [Crassisporium funariophilum]|nr:hypothetical protein B0H34DRAFT_747736 [Crassisporium funariophilum]
MKTAPLPNSIVFLAVASMLICVPMIALSVVNYGMLSIWLNSSVAVLALTFHMAFIIVALVQRRRNLRFTNEALLDPQSNSERQGHSMKGEDDAEKTAPTVAYSKWAVVGFALVFIMNLVALGVMIDITTRGAIGSTLPSEREGSAPWNIKVQIAQTSVLGAEFITLGITLIICALGRRRVMLEEEDKQAALDYGMASPVVSHCLIDFSRN